MMKEEIEFDADGNKIVFLVPETEEEVKELERRINAGEVDQRDSFADDPSAWDDGNQE
jgi:hypothetical protein